MFALLLVLVFVFVLEGCPNKLVVFFFVFGVVSDLLWTGFPNKLLALLELLPNKLFLVACDILLEGSFLGGRPISLIDIPDFCGFFSLSSVFSWAFCELIPCCCKIFSIILVLSSLKYLESCSSTPTALFIFFNLFCASI